MYLLQEEFGQDSPWRILVVCILLNRTQGPQARPIVEEFFRRWPNPNAFYVMADPKDVSALVGKLGLAKRASYLMDMTRQYLFHNEGDHVIRYAGCGAYAQEAYDMLILGRRWRWPMDPVLKARMKELLDPR